MKVLIYKRTHVNDPGESGCFGICGCMRRVRGWDFNAVIGIGGVGSKAVRSGIDSKITWIGTGPEKIGKGPDGYRMLGFEHFYRKEDKGYLLSDKAPKLADRILTRYGPRVLLVEGNAEIDALLKLARNSQPSPALLGRKAKPERSDCSLTKKC
ncbi:MAG TPA: hypothetical protein PK992_15245 [Planctomycetaceae bacterium]|nr:hypothetical protein [Planctomycetaceae bacterium]